MSNQEITSQSTRAEKARENKKEGQSSGQGDSEAGATESQDDKAEGSLPRELVAELTALLAEAEQEKSSEEASGAASEAGQKEDFSEPLPELDLGEPDLGGEVALAASDDEAVEAVGGGEEDDDDEEQEEAAEDPEAKQLRVERKERRERHAKDKVELARGRALRMARRIPAEEWCMPMTLWVVRGAVSAELMLSSYREAAGDGGVEERTASVWEADKKLTADAVSKAGQVVFIEQALGAKEAAKALLLAGKFVVWIARGAVEQYAKDNARGVVEAPGFVERMIDALVEYRERGWGVATPQGEPMEAALAKLGGGRVWPRGIETVALVLINNAFDECQARQVESPESEGSGRVDARLWEKIERGFGFVSNEFPDVRQGDPMRLSETTALASATREALERLAARMRTVGKGRGVLFHGLPGTGKTMLAKVVAIESGRRWVEASYARWQACEHLGEHLAAMAASFEEAISKAPSVMFIDELDSIGSREGETRNASYKIPVINAMLEWVQEAIARDVVIIGASNHPDKIDAALVRPGRLGDWIEIEYPGKEQRAQLIAKELPEVGDALAWASRIGRASPAKIMELVHEARERAKERGEAQAQRMDFEGAIECEVQRNLRGRSMRALALPVALGLCAKAWALKMAMPAGASEVRVLSADIAPGIEEVGRLELDGEFETGAGDLAWARLQVALAPAAARVARARDAATPDGLAALADLDQADRGQAHACLWELARSGMAGPSGHKGGAAWLDSAKGVDDLANTAWKAALASAHKAMPALVGAANQLAARGSMTGAELMAALGFAQAKAPARGGWTH